MLATMEQKLAVALVPVTASNWLRSLATTLDVVGLPTTGEGTYSMFPGMGVRVESFDSDWCQNEKAVLR